MNILEVRNLNKTYKDFQLKDVNLTIPKGYIMGFVGQNGAGKTSTINLINHICKCDSGSIKIDGISYADDPVRYKESIAYVGDECYFTKGLKVKNVKQTLKEFYPTFDSEKFDSLIEKYNLPINKNIINFSRGMKVKLMFATVFSRDAKLLILDEATNGLDPVVREELMGELQKYIENGERSILFSTHVLSDLEEIADYITFIDNGRIILQKPKDEMLEEYMIIKGDYSNLTEQQKKYLIGVENKNYGFEALIESNNAQNFDGQFVFEKPNVSQIMLHTIKEGRM